MYVMFANYIVTVIVFILFSVKTYLCSKTSEETPSAPREIYVESDRQGTLFF